MKKVGIRVNPDKVGRHEAEDISSWLVKKGYTPVLVSIGERIPAGLELLIVMGGDGTLLGASRAAAKTGVPIIGIDFGGMGFLSQIKFKDAKSALSQVLAGLYTIDERMMIEAEAFCRGAKKKKLLPAVNDVSVTRNSGRMIRLKIFINNNLMTELPGDGFIVASATGSTGYSLSAGGPVVAPELDVLVLTPICPHSLFGRSIVVSGGETIRVELPKDRSDLIMTIDGQKEYFPQSGGSVVIRRAPYSVKYVRVTESVFFETVKDKFRLA